MDIWVRLEMKEPAQATKRFKLFGLTMLDWRPNKPSSPHPKSPTEKKLAL